MRVSYTTFLLIIFLSLINVTQFYSQDVTDLNEKAMSVYKENQSKAILQLTKALTIAEKNNNKELISRTKNNLGIVYRDLGEFEKAKKLSIQALENTKNATLIASINVNIGACNRKLGLYEEAIKNYIKSLKIYESQNNLDKIATVNNNIAIVYSYLNLNKKSLEYYEKAIKVFEELDNKKGISQAYNNIAIVYANQGKLDEALTNFRYSLWLERNLKDKKGIAESLNNVGSVHYYLGKIDSAVYYFKQSADVERSIGNFAGVSASYNNIAQVFIENNQLKKSKKYIDSAYLIARKYKTSDDIEASLLNYTDYYEKKGDYKKSLDSYKKFAFFKDSISKKSNLNTIQEIETKYQTAKKEKEIAEQKEQILEQQLAIKNRNLYTLLLASALLILAIVFYAIFKRNQLKRKQLQKEIELKDALAIIKTQNRLQEQRLKISRDLHDNIGSQLTFIISSIDNLKYVTKDANSKLKEKLSNVSSFTSDTIHQLRDTIWAMNKNEISIEDLHTRILSYTEKAKLAANTTDFIIQQNITENFTLDSVSGINIFRAIQEAINNAIKYADASKIIISLFLIENKLHINIKDNGVGFDIKKVALGNGLANMEQRMSAIKGSVKVKSKNNEGTEIELILNKPNKANDV